MVYFYWRERVISPIMEKKVKGEQVMKKKKQRQTQRQTQMNQVKNESITIGDQLNTSLMDQLKSKKKGPEYKPGALKLSVIKLISMSHLSAFTETLADEYITHPIL